MIKFFKIYCLRQKGQRQAMYIQKPNFLSNKMEWHISEDEDMKNEIARSTYAGMLHDNERNEKYYSAIKKTIRKMKDDGKSTNVLDIGTGTGILSMMAASSGADSVIACEVFQPMAEIAKEVITRNGMESKIKIINKRSTEINAETDMEHKANILVTEIFDTELIGEGVLPTLRHAHEHLLQKDCKVIPEMGRLYVQVVESNVLWRRHKVTGLKLSSNKPLVMMSSHDNCKGTVSADELHIDEVGFLKMLSSPVEVKRFNFKELEKNSQTCSSSSLEVKIKSSGTAHCLILWWDLILNEEEDIILSMVPKCSAKNPNTVLWRDHWMQAVYYLPMEIHVTAGEDLNVSTFHDDYCFWFDVSLNTNHIAKKRCQMPVCICVLHTIWSRQRFTMINNREYWQNFVGAVEKIYACKNVVLLGDVSLLPLFISQIVEKVTYLEFSQNSKDIIKKLMCLNELSGKLKIITINDGAEENILQLLPTDKIDAVIAEPFFTSCLLPWENLSFWHHSSKIINERNKAPICIPEKAILKVVAVESENLWKVRKPVGDTDGFKLDAFDEIIEKALAPETCDQHEEAEPYSMWEYNNEFLSNIIDICSFDLTKEIPTEEQVFDGNIFHTRSGYCHAFIVWIDFCLDEEFSWSTGYEQSFCRWVNYSKQGVVFVKKPYEVSADFVTNYRIVFQPDFCNMFFKFISAVHS